MLNHSVIGPTEKLGWMLLNILTLRSFQGHFVTQKGQISKSFKYRRVIYQKKNMEETNTLVVFLGRNIHLISNKCRSNVYVTYVHERL